MADGDEPTETTNLNLGDGDADDGDCGAQVPMVSVTNMQSMPLTGRRGPHGRHMDRRAGESSGRAGEGETEELHPDGRLDNIQVEYVVVVRFDDSYMKTLAGVIRFLQVVSLNYNPCMTELFIV